MSCEKLLLCVLIILNSTILLQSSRTWSKQQLYPASKIPDDALNPKRTIVRQKIVDYHNFFRTKVSPPASNMLKMSWDPLAAQQAQAYADRCVYLKHNDPKENTIPKLGACGQNLFVAGQKTPWFFALKSWFLEYQNFTYGAPIRDFFAIGHYTQMVWATSYKVGCGLAHCPGGPWGYFYNYVCHYCPGGNIKGIIQYPYKIGKPCGDCPHDCYNGTLCTNPCPEKDYFSNCRELLTLAPAVCDPGADNCLATCQCGKSLLHSNHPFY